MLGTSILQFAISCYAVKEWFLGKLIMPFDVIGIDTCGTEDPYDDVLIFADPYDVTDHFQDGYYIFSLGRFFGMWREGPCAGKNEPYQQPFVAAWPK